MNGICAAPYCDRARTKREWCNKHYQRLLATGDARLATESHPDRLRARRAAIEAAVGGREIPGQLGFYVTPDGRVFTVNNGRGVRATPLELRAHLNTGGYPQVRLRGKSFPVHRLVAAAFLGPCPDGLEVRHLNGVRTDSRVENLAYGTKKENGQDRIQHGTNNAGERHPKARWSDTAVAEAVARYLAGGITQREIGELYGTSQQVVSRWVKASRLGGRTRYWRGDAA